eukprot:2685695-Alexandrium_andersonii.AAC.1
MSASLVGSEMCIRDSPSAARIARKRSKSPRARFKASLFFCGEGSGCKARGHSSACFSRIADSFQSALGPVIHACRIRLIEGAH